MGREGDMVLGMLSGVRGDVFVDGCKLRSEPIGPGVVEIEGLAAFQPGSACALSRNGVL